MIRPFRRWTASLAVTAAATLAASLLSAPAEARDTTAAGAAGASATAAEPEGPEQIRNGTFDDGVTTPWWHTANIAFDAADGRLCADIPGGTINPWDVIIGQDDIPLVQDETYAFAFSGAADPSRVVRALVQLPVDPYTAYLAANPQLTPETTSHSFTFTSPVSLPNGQVVFQLGGSATPWRFCVDDISLRGGAEPEEYEPDTGPRVRVNQVAYLPKGPKDATVVTDAEAALPWQLKNAGGTVVASGTSTPRGLDASSGQNVHSIDFGSYTTAGTGYTLTADGETSRPFDISPAAYQTLRTDALKFYYTQRSGVAIRDDLRPGYGRPAGHVGVAPNQGDTDVPCQPGVCDYRLDVSGGWYDAGDHGKYVVNGGISVAQLMSEFERTKNAATAAPLGDGMLALPESGNGVPDILDEARWEQEFLLKMQVPAGKPYAGMAHHKIHDQNWTGLPLMPHLDPQKRELHPVSTAATLNLAATAAQAARLYAPYDAAFAAANLSAARRAWAAAKANPAILASPSDATGGGAYNDDNVADEFYWAAAELFITTGEREFKDYVLASPQHTADIFGERGFDWGSVAALGRLDLATVPNDLPGRADVRASVVEGADAYLAAVEAHPYGTPYNPAQYDWGSNNLVLNMMVVMASAYDITGTPKYRNGVLEGIGYIFGRNALNQSYVTGYGEVASRNQHSRWYANQLDPALPNPPAGTLAGGPNSFLQDPTAAEKLQGCRPQFCYIDDIESWSTNELTINWNSPLAWISAFVAGQGDGTARAAGRCDVTYTTHGQWPSGFTTQVTIKNTGTTAINGWSLVWSFLGGQKTEAPWNVSLSQSGATVTAKNLSHNARIQPGSSITFGFNGKGGVGANPAPDLITLNGAACA
ncbi:glycoside hydrolase family 9 protein [Sphaerisporangium sp. TRM90804]|uniref:glycoside hydrolase family 9 protein n=1 Tax=Sphaerisporangium sp. TRM90804 TaxID=3031113 RepID=UPI002449C1EB|nr:glycoside hydrolase family 9 protein [Sphaerisporangium sp. TRM90804]MDH2427751.1 glycoside hydrolase family 9 protein [Sphaerisporangium sp. TRM90804]